ncbi:MAG: flavin reductase family protein [Rhodobacterales bacterium]|nr:flavin reductase family protein [Rhodobacterales bacterium]
MYYDAGTPHGLPHDPFKSCIVPRPIAWITTLSADGVVNLAPFSFFNGIASDPPMVMFSATGTTLGQPKDTLRNCRETGEFVVNMATEDMKEAMNATCAPLPPEDDELALAGLTALPSRHVAPPRVAESPVHLECRVHDVIALPADDPASPNTLVLGRVLGVHIDERVLTDGLIDMEKARPLARLGYKDYTVVDRVFAMDRPQGRP